MLILYRVLCLIGGYIFGLFQTGYLYGKRHGIDIREHGSGNSGTTNTLRTLGWKAGAITFIGDFFKCVIAIVLAWVIFHNAYPEQVKCLCSYAGFGAVLGHNFPFYLNFKGGKGIACTAAMIICLCPYAVPVCLLSFLVAVGITRYVSLGSILVVILYLVQIFVLYLNGMLGVEGDYACEFVILAACFTFMAIWQHRANIKRLLNGTENKFGSPKKEN